MWQQELMWIKRNEQDVIVGMRELPPGNEDFIPTLPVKEILSRKEAKPIGNCRTTY